MPTSTDGNLTHTPSAPLVTQAILPNQPPHTILELVE